MTPAAKTASRARKKTSSAARKTGGKGRAGATRSRKAAKAKPAPAKGAAKKASTKAAPKKRSARRAKPKSGSKTGRSPSPARGRTSPARSSASAAGKRAPLKAASRSVTAAKAKRGTAAKAKRGTAAKASRASARRRRAPRTILAELFQNLDRIFGPITLPETNNTLEKAVYLVLREGGTELTTAKAMKALMAEFVDWNEVRVSRSSELARLMSGTSKVSGIRRFHKRSTRLREMIDQIYGDRNETSLEFLEEEKPKAQLEYLEDFDDLGLHNAYALVQWLSERDDLVLISREMAAAAQRLGLIESAAVTKARKALNALVSTRQKRVTLQAHLNQLGQREPEAWPTAIKEMLP